MAHAFSKRRRGFTLVELLVCIVVILVLVAVVLPIVYQAREAARRTTCKNNLKQLGTALRNYHENWETFPPGWMPTHPDDSTGADSWAWAVLMMPYLDGSTLYSQLHDDSSFPPSSETKLDVSLPVFLCPTDSSPKHNRFYAGYATANYAGVHGGGVSEVSDDLDQPGNGVFSERSSIALDDIIDGDKHTFLVGERAWRETGSAGAIWMRSINEAGDGGDGTAVAGVCDESAMLNDFTNPDAFSSSHEGGAHFLHADGSVRFVADDIEAEVYERLAAIADEE